VPWTLASGSATATPVSAWIWAGVTTWQRVDDADAAADVVVGVEDELPQALSPSASASAPLIRATAPGGIR